MASGRITFDHLGRRTELANPDTGKVVMTYDPAGNLIHKETPNLRALGETIVYRYEYNRLTAIEYPQYPDSNVSYQYGAPNAPNNSANRIVKITDQGGWETREYGPLGELTQSTRYLEWSAGPGEQYTTQYQYDTWNRLQQLIYPDGEVLTYDYDYDLGGQMTAVQGRKGRYDYPYVQRMDYDKFGQRRYVLHGNNTVSRYRYDPYNRRLSQLTVGKGDGNPFMDLAYDYDPVGNITALANRAINTSPSQMGGATNYSYQYDDLYRLTGSSGSYDTPPGKQHRYSLSMAYDPIHNITRKTQAHTLVQKSGTVVPQKKTSYDWSYRYDGEQPHAPTHLGERTFSYDANGNQLGWTHDQNGTRRTITWDDDNRIREIKDNGHRLTYTYDAAGQRLTKRGPQGETGYINQWFTLRNGEVGTKHVYAGTTRVVSKLVKQDKPNSKRKGRIVYEKDQYTYHPDHLGTSAYITHTNGQVYQHLEYFPFGETWVEEHSNKQRTPYLFTAKELDEESQLYYFGARYYDPRTSVWVSVDPILGSYLDGKPNAGVFNSKNLSLFGYSYNHPVTLFDAQGLFPEGGESYPYTAHNGMQAHAKFSDHLYGAYGPSVKVDTPASAILRDFFGMDVTSNLRPDAVFSDGDTLELKPITHINRPDLQSSDDAQLQGYISLAPGNLREGEATQKVPGLEGGGPLTIGEIKSESDGTYYNVNIYGGEKDRVPKGFVYYSLTPSSRQSGDRLIDTAIDALMFRGLRKPPKPSGDPSPVPAQ